MFATCSTDRNIVSGECGSITGSRAAGRARALYERRVLLEALDPALLGRISLLEIHESLPSTNERLMQVPATSPEGSLAVCLASHQSAGRGRNGKSWHSPAGAGLLLSVSRTAPILPDGSLALALGVAIAEGLEAFLLDRVELKWPNDLVAQDRKLGGILVETSTQPTLGGRASRPPRKRDAFAPGSPAQPTLGGRASRPPRKRDAFAPGNSMQPTLGGRGSRHPRRRDAFAPGSSAQGAAETRVVAGVGVNIRVSEEQRERVTGEGGIRPAGLSELNLRKAPEPNVLAAAMITAIADVLESHPVDGFCRWSDGWNRRDWLAGKRIEARSGASTHLGVAAGVDSSGALLLNDSDGQQRILSAEIRL